MVAIDVIARDKASQTFRQVGTAAEESGKKMSAFGSAIADAGKVAATAFSAVAVVDFFKDSIKSATDLQRSLLSVKAVFKGSFSEINDASEKAAKTVGLSSDAYDQLAVKVGSAFKNMGVSADELAPKTEDLIKLGADLAAQFGGDTQTAVKALDSAFLGQTRALKQYGISISQADIKSYELAHGLDTSTNAAKVTSKQIATYQLILQKTGDAAGAFARNSDTIAEKQQIANAQFDDAKEKLGTALLPVMAEVTGEGAKLATALSDVVTWFVQLPGPVKDVAIGLAGIKALQVVGVFDKIGAGLKIMRSEFAAGLASDVVSAGAKFDAIATEAQVASDKMVASAATAKEAWAGVPAAGGVGAGAASAAGGLFVNPVSVTLGALTVANIAATSLSVDAINANAVKTGGTQVNQGEVGAAGQANASTGTPGLFGGGIDILGIGGHAKELTQTFVALGQSVPVGALSALHGDLSDLSTGAGSFRAAEESADAAGQSFLTFRDLMTRGGQGAVAVWEGSGKKLKQVWTAVGKSVPVSAIAAIHEPLSRTAQAFVENALGAQASNRAMADAKLRFDGVGKSAGLALTDVTNFGLALDTLANRHSASDAAARAAQEAIRGIGSAYRQQAAATDAVKQAQIDLTAAEDKKIGKDYTAQQKVLDVAAAQRNLKDAQDGVKDSADQMAQAQDTVVQTAQQQVLATYQATLKHKGYTAAVEAATAKMQGERDAFIAQAEQAGYSAAAAGKLADKLGLIPRNVKTTIDANTTQAQQDIDAIRVSMTNLNGMRITTYVNTVTGETHFRSGSGATGFAAGGAITGPGMKGVDSQLRLLAPGEHVLTASDVDALGGQGGVYALRRSLHGGMLGMAAGGSVPSAAALAGISSPSYGPVRGTYLSALGDFRGEVAATAQAAADAAGKAKDLGDAYRQQVSAAAQVAKDQAAKVADARQRLGEAKTTASRQSAERALTRARAAQIKSNDAENAKTVATLKAWDASKKLALADKERAAATADVVSKTRALQNVQSSLAAALDRTETNLGAAKDKLSGLFGDRSQLASSVAGAVAGTGGGILGFAAQRTSGASILNGLKYDLRQTQKFQGGLARLAKLGLNQQDLETLASAGADQAGATVAALVASPGLIGQINRTETGIRGLAGRAGNTVAGRAFNAQIAAQERVVSRWEATATRIERAMKNNAKELETTMVRALDGMRLEINPQGVARLVRKGEAELARR